VTRARSFALAGILLCSAHAAAAQNGHAERFFRTSEVCFACHNALTTQSGADISIASNWRASMMANSARDPYWQAAVRREIIDHPSAREEIEDVCSTCHMPGARFNARAAGSKGQVFRHLTGDARHTQAARLALDGVTCTVCHQIEADRLGTRASFNGGFVVDTMRGLGQRRIFGPFHMDSGRASVMRSAARFQPWTASHIESSDLCGSCHTLFTETLDRTGRVLGKFPEQTPFLEWRHSAYRYERSCQSCHMPVVPDSAAMSSVLGQPRAGISRHVFRGGNFFMLRMLNRYRDQLAVAALPQELEREAAATIEHLRSATALVSIEHSSIRGTQLVADVLVQNQAGHKLPTAYPSRRAWLHVRVRDAAGRVLFESGAFRPDGSIVGNDNDRDPATFEPHYQQIERANQVQIYEAIMHDPAGRVTTGLLSAHRYAKDNRLLPRGFNKETASTEIAVQGGAREDQDFSAGRDRVRYIIDVGQAARPLTIDVQLWYQPIAYRWAHNLAAYDAFETRRFVAWFNAMAEASALVLASAQAAVP
jgi:hypothetical protein